MLWALGHALRSCPPHVSPGSLLSHRPHCSLLSQRHNFNILHLQTGWGPTHTKGSHVQLQMYQGPPAPLPPGIAGPAQMSLGSRGCEVAPHEAERANLSAQGHVTKSPPRDRSALPAEVAPARAQCLGRADKLLRKTDPKGREKGCRWGCWRIPPLQHLSSSHVSMNGTTVRTENGPPSGDTVLFEPLRLLHFSVKSPHHPAHHHVWAEHRGSCVPGPWGHCYGRGRGGAPTHRKTALPATFIKYL